MIHTIKPHHKNFWHRWISSDSYTYYQYKFRRLYSSINWIHYCSPSRTKTYCSLTFVCERYTKCSKTNIKNPQPRNSCIKNHWDNTHYNFPSEYIPIWINFKINSCCTQPCSRSKGGIIHCISSLGASPRTTINSKFGTFRYHQTSIICTEANIIKLPSSTKK